MMRYISYIKRIFIVMLKFSCVLDVQISFFPRIPKSLLTPNQLQDSSQTLSMNDRRLQI